MNGRLSRNLLSLIILLCATGCANIVPPAGGSKDVTPPKRVSVTPADSLRNVRTTKVRLDFDEYITVTDPNTQIQFSPLLPVPPVVVALNKHLTISIPDSLLQENTTYRISFGNAIRDIHEGNIYNGSAYTFSTGSYFDSLSIEGKVINAATGLPDSAASVLLYNEADGDSIVVKRKPMYATHVDKQGVFSFKGLPAKRFRIYALQDKNANLIFDDHAEWIAFREETIVPGIDSAKTYELRTFPQANTDTLKTPDKTVNTKTAIADAPGPAYSVEVDTNDYNKRRTQDITKPISIQFNKKPGAINAEKIFLTYDSTGITVETSVQVRLDTATRKLLIAPKWVENGLYTLRLQKGFAKDTAGQDMFPGRYTFRAKRDEDYAKLQVHLPTKYFGNGYLLQVNNETDTLYQQPVTDTIVNLVHIPAGNYRMRIIEDKNKNGHWDTGDLFGKKQPELVIPYEQTQMLKAGWENQIDFEPIVKPITKPGLKSPQKSSPEVVK